MPQHQDYSKLTVNFGNSWLTSLARFMKYLVFEKDGRLTISNSESVILEPCTGSIGQSCFIVSNQSRIFLPLEFRKQGLIKYMYVISWRDWRKHLMQEDDLPGMPMSRRRAEHLVVLLLSKNGEKIHTEDFDLLTGFVVSNLIYC